MSELKIEDLRFSSSSIDDFFVPKHKTAGDLSIGKIRISNLQELAGFQFITEDQLVHLSKKDFWRLGKDEEGHYIERLVSDDNGPVKE